MTTYRTQCSNCWQDLTVTLNGTTGTIRGEIPANGLRGSKHVPAHTLVGEAWIADDDGLVYWDCPACGYADSYWADFNREFAEWLS